MQKKLIALAVAGLASTAAFAQSNVTVYGVMDATYDYVGASQSTAATKVKNDSRVSANSSYLGFKGAEDLGNGLKAVFQIEGNLFNDNAGGWDGSARDTYVGLTGGFGTVVAGTLTAAARGLGAKVDVNAGSTGIGYQSALYARLAVLSPVLIIELRTPSPTSPRASTVSPPWLPGVLVPSRRIPLPVPTTSGPWA